MASRVSFQRSMILGQWVIAVALVVASLVVAARRGGDGARRPNADALGPTFFDGRLLYARAPDGGDTLVLFTDFECPYCRMLAERLRGRDLPRTVALRFLPRRGAGGRDGAVLTYCADAQGRTREVHDAIFALPEVPPSEALLRAVPGLSADSFVACVGSPAARQAVTADARLAYELGVVGTPSVLADGRLFEGLEAVWRELTRRE